MENQEQGNTGTEPTESSGAEYERTYEVLDTASGEMKIVSEAEYLSQPAEEAPQVENQEEAKEESAPVVETAPDFEKVIQEAEAAKRSVPQTEPIKPQEVSSSDEEDADETIEEMVKRLAKKEAAEQVAAVKAEYAEKLRVVDKMQAAETERWRETERGKLWATIEANGLDPESTKDALVRYIGAQDAGEVALLKEKLPGAKFGEFMLFQMMNKSGVSPRPRQSASAPAPLSEAEIVNGNMRGNGGQSYTGKTVELTEDMTQKIYKEMQDGTFNPAKYPGVSFQ